MAFEVLISLCFHSIKYIKKMEAVQNSNHFYMYKTSCWRTSLGINACNIRDIFWVFYLSDLINLIDNVFEKKIYFFNTCVLHMQFISSYKGILMVNVFVHFGMLCNVQLAMSKCFTKLFSRLHLNSVYTIVPLRVPQPV